MSILYLTHNKGTGVNPGEKEKKEIDNEKRVRESVCVCEREINPILASFI